LFILATHDKNEEWAMRARWWFCLGLLALPLAVFAQPAADNPLGMSRTDTAQAHFIYFDPLGFLAPHAVQTFKNSWNWQRTRFGWTPSEPVTVLLMDWSDYGNAGAVGAPHSRIIFQVSPPSHAFETNTASERFYSTLNHELVHIVQADVASPEDAFWRGFFLGKVGASASNPETILYNYLTTPRFAAPRWYVEGTAVFMETWMGGGLGRAQGGYDEMVFRAMVRDKDPFYDPLGIESKGVRSDFQALANAYLYGTRFVTWAAWRWSPGKVVEWMRRDKGSKRYFADQFEHVFGLPLNDAWQQWIASEQDFQSRNLAEVRRFPVTPEKRLVDHAIGSISRVYFDEAKGVLYGGFRFPGIVEHVGGLNTRDGTISRIADIKNAMLYRVTSFAFDAQSRTAFFTNNNLKHRDLMAVNVDTGEQRMLLEGARIGEIVFNPQDKSLLGVRHDRGIASLVRIPYPYNDWQVVHEFAYEEVPTDMDISPDGRLLSASVGTPTGDQFLRVWELNKVLAGDLKPLSEFGFGQSVPESFVFSRDGKYLYGSSYYTGVSNIFRYEVATGDVVAVSNAELGLFRPVPLSDGRLLALSYTAQGFVPVTIDPKPIKDVSAIKFLGAQLVKKYPVVKQWEVPPPNTVDPKKEIVSVEPFRPTHSLQVESGYPVLQGYKNAVGLGYKLNLSDTLGFAHLSFTGAYTPSNNLPANERAHFEIAGDYLGWRASIAQNKSDFYDLFGPTKRSRKGTAVNLGYDDLLIYDDPRTLTLKYDLRWRNGIDTLPEAQNVGLPFTRLAQAEVGLYYKDLQKSLGAVDEEKGVVASMAGQATRVNGDVIAQLVADGAGGWQFGLAHSSVWLRGAAGSVNGDRNNPVANFYFGGFGNNYVDSREIKRYHEWQSMPGFGIDEISGQKFAKATAEWNVPPLVFESAGWPAFHATWLRTSVFTSMLVTDPQDRNLRERWSNIGVQSDMRFSVLHWNELTLSAGYAVGFRGGKRKGSEFMVSLKIL
jgi:hypothetical protein